MRTRRILFARSADASNFNAQAKNVQNILSRWQSSEYRPAVFSFSEPHPGVAQNPNVDILRIQDAHLWRAQVFVNYLRSFDAVFCPGIHHIADWAALRTRAAIGRPLPIISTMEGLLSVHEGDEREQRYAAVAGHKVFGQQVTEDRLARVEWILRAADHIIAISPFLERQAQAEFGDKVTCLPLGVDATVFQTRQETERSRPRVISAGNVRAHKRPEAFLALAMTFPEADFVWFGDGDLRGPLSAEAELRGLKNVNFPGPRQPDQLAWEMAHSEIFVLTSLGEGVPKVTQEAASVGLPQIVFGFYEAPTVSDGDNGFVVWSDDEFRFRLRLLIEDQVLRERMGRKGAEMAREWMWETVAPRWQDGITAAIRTALEHRTFPKETLK